MTRDLVEVLDKILLLVPEEHSIYESLKSVRTSAIYCAPEAMWQWWQVGTKILAEGIGEPLVAWEFKVADLWNDTKSV